MLSGGIGLVRGYTILSSTLLFAFDPMKYFLLLCEFFFAQLVEYPSIN